MKFSIKIQYGLQALLELALGYGNAPRQTKEIAKTQKIPLRFLEQLMLLLKRGELVTSLRGLHGGFTLASHPSEITLLQIVEVLDGPIELANKKLKKIPVLFDTFTNVQESIRQHLVSVTLEDLAMRKRQKDRAYIYNI